MTTIYINCSPKKRFSASSYLISLQKIFAHQSSKTLYLRSKANIRTILENIQPNDTVVFALPLYVDGLPSPVLYLLKAMEPMHLNLSIYVLANNGFIEGKQNEALMQVFENFCVRSHNHWKGGIGIGGGVMLNVTRLLFGINIVLLPIQLLAEGNLLSHKVWIPFLENVGILLFFNLGVLFYIIQMGMAMRKQAEFGKKYTRILLPSFVFILFADIFFLIVSTFQGGLFKNWLRPTNKSQIIKR